MKRVALVTGGVRGIGFAIAQKLAGEGFALAIADVRADDEAAQMLQPLAGLGNDLLYCRCDVSKAADRKSMLDAIRARFGRLNILVNNAGIAPKERLDILDATEESFELLMRVNLQGPYFLTQAVANWMIEQKNAAPDFAGCIVNISSISATVASTGRGEYCISKAGVAMASRLWAARLGEYDIPVYDVRPGIIKTDMTAAVQAKYDKMLAEGVALQRRWGTPEDVGRLVASLARGDFAYSTGSVFMVDGGMHVQRL